jgi:hypothetical protein
MKIRIKNNSVRFRLTKSDVSQLAEKGFLEDSISFGNAALAFAVKATISQTLTATFVNDEITLFLPQHMVTELASTDRVGFEDTAGELHVLVEKDFTCLENVAEDQSDNYPNPLADNYKEK